jgi:polyisoprenoid-binding protein YceI
VPSRQPNPNTAQKSATVTGSLTAISGTTLPATVTITPTAGAAVTLTVTANTKVVRNGQAATLAALKTGDAVTAAYNPTTLTAVMLVAGVKLSEVRGTLTAISGTTLPATVTITPTAGATVTLTVTASTTITRNGQTATLAALQVNDHVRATYDSSNNAVTLASHVKLSEVRGTLTAISGTTLPATVTITPATGTAVTLTVTANTKIVRNGQAATLTDLQVGDMARAHYDSSGTAVTLTAGTKLSRVRGTLTAIGGTTVPTTVTITPANGTAVTLTVTASTKIVRGGLTATLADLQVNDQVQATYDASNNAVTLTECGP